MADIKFYRSTVDEFDSSVNGGSITTTLIEDGVVNNLFWDIRADTVEVGKDRYVKFFIIATVDVINVGICIGLSNFDRGDKVYLTQGTDSDVEDDLDKESLRLYGAFNVSSVDYANKKVTADRDVSEFVKADDRVTFYDNTFYRIVAYEVESVNGSEITFKAVDTNKDITDAIGCGTIVTSAINSGNSIGFWVKEEVLPQVLPNDNPVYFKILTWYEKQ